MSVPPAEVIDFKMGSAKPTDRMLGLSPSSDREAACGGRMGARAVGQKDDPAQTTVSRHLRDECTCPQGLVIGVRSKDHPPCAAPDARREERGAHHKRSAFDQIS